MIDSKIIKLASFTKNVGLKNKFTINQSVKNSICVILSKPNLLQKNQVNAIRVESCILCEASAGLFSRKIKNLKINDVVDEIKLMMKYKKKETNYIFSKNERF